MFIQSSHKYIYNYRQQSGLSRTESIKKGPINGTWISPWGQASPRNGRVFQALHEMLSIHQLTSWQGKGYYPHFMDKEGKVQQDTIFYCSHTILGDLGCDGDPGPA